ncbi:MAG: hypothetical protein R2911_33150 [Caldilineaceae bacterium]
MENVNFSLGRAMLRVKSASLSLDGFTIKAAELQLPKARGASELQKSARITNNGQITLASGSASFKFPNINVGGANGFSIEGAAVTLTVNGAEYLFSGSGTFLECQDWFLEIVIAK